MRATPNKSKYLEIAELYMEQIIEGRLPPGERIPSVRETAIHMGVTPNTAANAHAQLRDMGIINPVHGTGSVIEHDAPEICRAYIEKQFMEREIPVIRQRIALLGLSDEHILELLKNTSCNNTVKSEKKK